jgi:hypothetical protein
MSLEEIRAAIDPLKRMFDENWMRLALAKPPNAIVPMLYASGGSWCLEIYLARTHRIGAIDIPTPYRPLRDLMGTSPRPRCLKCR